MTPVLAIKGKRRQRIIIELPPKCPIGIGETMFIDIDSGNNIWAKTHEVIRIEKRSF